MKNSYNSDFKINPNSFGKKLVKKRLLDVYITDASKDDILEYILEKIENTQENLYVVTPNPEIITYAHDNPYFKKILNEATLSLCDGVGVVWAGNLLGIHFSERFTGVDFVQALCDKVANRPISVGFLGGGDAVAKEAAERLTKQFPLLDVAFIYQEWNPQAEIQLQKKQVDILFIAYGFPKQEKWMYEHINKIPVRVMIGVGGSFDYISGNVKRAPNWIREVGFEWLYRLIKQPWRWRRQLALIEFSLLVCKERIRGKNLK